MIARTVFAAALAVSALAAPAAVAAPDLSQLVVAPTDLPSGTSVLAEQSFPLGKGVREYDRYFRLPRSSGFARVNSSVVLFKRGRDAGLLLEASRLAMRDPDTRRGLARFTASELGVRARRIRIGKPRPLHIGDGGFTVGIRVNRKTAIVVGIFRLDRALGEIDARGTSPSGHPDPYARSSAHRGGPHPQGLSPQPLTPPTITGTAQVGAVLQAAPGTWSAATSFSYAWQRCNAAGTCVEVPGATQQTYAVTAADAGSTLRVVVTAANAVGQTTSTSAPTAPVPVP